MDTRFTVNPSARPAGKVRRSVLALLLLAASHQVLGAADCAAMLQPYWDWAAKSDSFYTYSVHATMTKQSSTNLSRPYDPVWYANGEVRPHTGWYPSLGNDLQLLTNASAFGVNAANTMALSVALNGFVSAQQKINGTPVGLVPPVTFFGTCADGLITGSVGGAAYIISFTKVRDLPVVK